MRGTNLPNEAKEWRRLKRNRTKGCVHWMMLCRGGSRRSNLDMTFQTPKQMAQTNQSKKLEIPSFKPFFSHGQFIVALSEGISRRTMKVLAKPVRRESKVDRMETPKVYFVGYMETLVPTSLYLSSPLRQPICRWMLFSLGASPSILELVWADQIHSTEPMPYSFSRMLQHQPPSLLALTSHTFDLKNRWVSI